MAPPILTGTQYSVPSNWGLGPSLVSQVPCIGEALGMVGEKFYDPSFGSLGLIPGGLKIFHTLKIAFRCEGKSSRQSFQTIRRFHKSSFYGQKWARSQTQASSLLNEIITLRNYTDNKLH